MTLPRTATHPGRTGTWRRRSRRDAAPRYRLSAVLHLSARRRDRNRHWPGRRPVRVLDPLPFPLTVHLRGAGQVLRQRRAGHLLYGRGEEEPLRRQGRQRRLHHRPENPTASAAGERLLPRGRRQRRLLGRPRATTSATWGRAKTAATAGRQRPPLRRPRRRPALRRPRLRLLRRRPAASATRTNARPGRGIDRRAPTGPRSAPAVAPRRPRRLDLHPRRRGDRPVGPLLARSSPASSGAARSPRHQAIEGVGSLHRQALWRYGPTRRPRSYLGASERIPSTA